MLQRYEIAMTRSGHCYIHHVFYQFYMVETTDAQICASVHSNGKFDKIHAGDSSPWVTKNRLLIFRVSNIKMVVLLFIELSRYNLKLMMKSSPYAKPVCHSQPSELRWMTLNEANVL